MSDNIEKTPPEMSETRSQTDKELLAEELKAWQNKVKELDAYYKLLKQENVHAKKKHVELQQQIAMATATLEANTRIFGELYEDSKTAVQMARDSYLNSTVNVPSQKVENIRMSPPKQKPSVSSLNSGKVLSSLPIVQPVTRRKTENLEPIQMQFDDLESEEEISEDINRSPYLSVIEEESASASSYASPTRIPYVRLTQLPDDILEKHLQNPANSDSSLDTTFSEDSMLSSTPNKLEHMRRLGLSPAPPNDHSSRFSRVTIRKNRSKSDETRSSSSSKQSEKSEVELRKKTGTTSGRPPRKTKPQVLKEPSLRKKMRR